MFNFPEVFVFYTDDQPVEQTGVWLQGVNTSELQQIKSMLKDQLSCLEEDRGYLKHIAKNHNDPEVKNFYWSKYNKTSKTINKLAALQTKIKRTLS